MYKIIRKKPFNAETCLMEVHAPDLAAAAAPGQFVILRVDEQGERFPLTIYGSNTETGTITVVFQGIGVSTKKLCALNVGDSISDITGPLGHATNTKDIGKVICIGGGVGIAELYPVSKAMAENGNDVTVILGARTDKLIICESEIREFCDKVYISTDDGSSGIKGFVTDVLNDLLEKSEYDLIFVIGPAIMMKTVAEMTRPKGIKTLVSLNSIMIDGTGMCGCCRIKYDGETKFTCVEGPEFDAHLVDFDDMINRLDMYKDYEKRALEHYGRECNIGLKTG